MSRPRRRAAVLGVLAGAVAALALAIVPVTSASAHDYLVDSSPAANSTVTAALSTVSVTFNDVILDLTGDGASAVLEVTGPGSASTHYETGCPTILGRTISAPVQLGAAGVYQVSWQIVSSDGHPVSNAITFTYAPAAGAAAAGSATAGSATAGSATAGSATGPVCGNAVSTGVAALPGADAGSSSGAASAGSGASDGALIILGIAGGIVLLAVVGVVLVLVLSRRSRRSDAESGGSAGSGESGGSGGSAGSAAAGAGSGVAGRSSGTSPASGGDRNRRNLTRMSKAKNSSELCNPFAGSSPKPFRAENCGLQLRWRSLGTRRRQAFPAVVTPHCGSAWRRSSPCEEPCRPCAKPCRASLLIGGEPIRC